MRKSLVLAFILSVSSLTYAAKLKIVDDFYSESETLLKSKKTTAIQDFEKSLKSTMDQYEKQDPAQGGKAEHEVVVLYYTLEPVFKLSHDKKITSENCAKVRQEVKTSDSMGRPEGSPATKQADLALKWLKSICPAVKE